MGTGIGKDCQICGDQLNDAVGYDYMQEICANCQELIPNVLYYLSNKEQ